jgi:hypothetical protein
MTTTDWAQKAQEIYDAAEKSGGNYTRCSTVRRKLLAAGASEAEAQQAVDALKLEHVNN